MAKIAIFEAGLLQNAWDSLGVRQGIVQKGLSAHFEQKKSVFLRTFVARKWPFLPFLDPKTPQNGPNRPGISLFRAKNTHPIRPEAIRSTSAHHT